MSRILKGSLKGLCHHLSPSSKCTCTLDAIFCFLQVSVSSRMLSSGILSPNVQYTCNLSAANFRLLSIFAAFPRYYLQESRMFCLLTMKDDENVHPVKLILCQCEKIIKLILCLIFHLLPSRITEISLRKTNYSHFVFSPSQTNMEHFWNAYELRCQHISC